MSQRNFLNLTHNPFVPPREGFYPGADRKSHLQHLQTLDQWARSIVLVTGELGIGKSTLFRELSNTLEVKAKAARLSGTIVSSEREVLVSLINGFGIAASSDATSDELADLITQHAHDQQAHGRCCVVMVDEAHKLDASSVNRLTHLVLEAPVRVVMFAEPAIVTTVTRACDKHELEWFEIRLTGYPKNDVRHYLEWRFSQAQYRGLLPFTDEQVQEIVTRSSGNPSSIDAMANDMLSRLEAGDVKKLAARFPGVHFVLAALIACGVGLIYMLVQPRDGTPLTQTASQTEQASDVERPQGRESEGSFGAARSTVDDPVPVALPEPDEIELLASVEPGAVGLATEQPSFSEGDAAPVESEGQPSTPSSPQSDLVQQAPPGQLPPGQLPPGQVRNQQATTQSVPAPVSIVESKPIESDPEPPESQSRVAADNQVSSDVRETDVSPSNAGRVVADVEVTQPTRASAPAPTARAPEPTVSPARARTIRDSQWILRQNPDTFTLQLVSVSTLANARALILRQSDPDEYAIYRLSRGPRMLYVVVYGVFSSTGAALDAADRLRGELSQLSPIVRSMRSIQNALQ